VKERARKKKASAKSKSSRTAQALEEIEFEDAGAWRAWLQKNFRRTAGVWVVMAKRATGKRSITHAEAVDGALRWGWIDGQGRSVDKRHWAVKFTPRRARSKWSKINRERALVLIAQGEMEAPGLAEVERAKLDGRWDAAYDSPRNASVPDDLAAALARDAKARKFFEQLDSANRYAILWRLQTAKRAETRARRLAQFVEMLARHEKLH
jgi:uncharacterized protein YdeI (YjbR/CyaY-like superfamily)